MVWDIFILLLVFWSSLWEPYKAAFVSLRAEGYEISVLLVDTVFAIDILISFHTGFDKGFEIIMEKEMIIYHYLRGWFLIDLVATLPWDIIIKMVMSLSSSGDSDSAVSNSPLIRLLKLLRVLRVMRAGGLIDRLFQAKAWKTGYIEGVKFFLYVAVVAHLLACFFYISHCTLNQIS